MKSEKFRVYKVFVEERDIKIERKINKKQESRSIRKEGDPFVKRDLREQLEFLLNNSEIFRDKEELTEIIYKGSNGLGAEVLLIVTKTNKK